MTSQDTGYNDEIPKGATHKLIVCDTFDWEDYNVYAFGKTDLERKKIEYSQNMQKIKEIIELK